MKRNSILALAMMLTFGLLLAACGGNTGDSGSESEGNNGGGDEGDSFTSSLTLGSGSTGGTYYPFGGEIATILNDNIDVEGFEVSSVSSGASVENIANIGQGKWQLGLAQNTTSLDAINGRADFEGNKVDNFGVIASLYPEAMHVVTLGSTGIDSIADLKGKKVAIGPPGGAIRYAAEFVLKAYGIEEGDYTPFKEGLGDAKDKLQNGTIDATIDVTAVPAPSANELHASTKDVEFLSLDEKAVQMFEEETTYEEYVIEPGTYEWEDEPVTTVTATALLIASTDQVSEELGYEITKAIFENSEDMSIKQAEMISEDNAFIGVQDLPLHPGAKKYYKEIGILENYEGEK